MIEYIDDVLLFLKSITKHFNNLQKFLNIIKQNGLVISMLKMMLIKNIFFRVQYILRINNPYHHINKIS